MLLEQRALFADGGIVLAIEPRFEFTSFEHCEFLACDVRALRAMAERVDAVDES